MNGFQAGATQTGLYNTRIRQDLHIAYAKNMVSYDAVRIVIKQSYSSFSNLCLTTINRNHQENDAYGHSLNFPLYFITKSVIKQSNTKI